MRFIAESYPSFLLAATFFVKFLSIFFSFPFPLPLFDRLYLGTRDMEGDVSGAAKLAIINLR